MTTATAIRRGLAHPTGGVFAEGPRDEIRLRVKRRGQLYRLIDDASGLLARDGSGEAIDYGGFRRRSQAERAARLLKSEVRRRLRTGYRPTEASNDKVQVLPAVTVDDGQATASLASPTYHRGSVRVVGVDRERGIVALGDRRPRARYTGPMSGPGFLVLE